MAHAGIKHEPANALHPEDLFCPFPVALHPATDNVHSQSVNWLVRTGLLDRGDTDSRLLTEQYTWLAARMFPDATLAQIQLLSDFTSWLFVHDDLCDDSEISADPEQMAATFRREMDLLLGQGHPDQTLPMEVSLVDLRDRFRSTAPDPGWMSRFVASMQDYLDACLWESENRRNASTPSAHSFIPMRPHAGGVWVYMNFLELMHPLPLVVRESRPIQRLRQITVNVVSWHNDLYSLEKERRVGDVHNLVCILQQERSIPADDANRLAFRFCDDEVRRFLAIERSLPTFGAQLDGAAHAYVDAMKTFVGGALAWAQEAHRYGAAVRAE